MSNRMVVLKEDVFVMMKACKDEYLKHHPEMRNVPISNNKILYETMRVYLGLK